MSCDLVLNYISGCIPQFDLNIITRLFVSALLGLIIGIEREITNKTAGLRTHILVSLGSTVFTILSIYGFTCGTTGDDIKLVHDPSRIAAQIVTGIGFIGGGAVLHYGMNVFGITTAATLWITASIGMAVGAGVYDTAIIATFLTFFILVFVRKFENKFLSRITAKGGRVKVTVSCQKEHQAALQDWFYKEFKQISEISASIKKDNSNNVKITFLLDSQEKDPVNVIYKKVSVLENFESISVEQILA